MQKIPTIKSLFANIGLIVLLNFLVKPVWLLAEMVIQDKVGHEDWGMYSALLSFGFLFIAFSDFGINQYSTKTLASKPELMRSYFPNLITVKLFLAVAFPFLMLLIGWIWGYREEKLYFLLLICFIHGGNQIIQFFRANFQAMQRFKIDGFMSVFDRVVLLILVVYLFYTQLDIERFIFIRILTIGITVLFSYIFISRIYGWLKPKLEIPLIKNIVRLSLSFTFMTMLYSIHDKVDQVMLERLAGEAENGLYAAAYRWLDAFSMYLWTVLPIFFARFAFYITDLKEQEKLLHFGQVIAALPIMFVSVFVFFYGEKLLFLFGNSTPEEITVIRQCLVALFVAAFFNSIFAIFSTLLTSTNHERYVNWLITASILLNITLNLIFIPTYGAIATAWTTTVSYVFIDIAYVVYIELNIDIKVPYFQMLKLAIIGTLLGGIFWGLTQTTFPWYINTTIAGILFIGLSFAMKLISIKMLRSFKV